MNNVQKTVCFSGHRVLYEPKDKIKVKTEIAVRKCIEQGFETFILGGAVGFDTLAAETVLHIKEDYPNIRLIMDLPCPPEQQSLKWNDKQKEQYYKFLEQADKVCVLSPQYTDTCMLDRNRHMVDSSALLVCYLRKQCGGTFYTVNYAEKKGLEILRL